MLRPTKDEIHYLLLKVHSLTGIVPIGAFLVIHLSINSLRTVGVLPYQLSIDVLNNLPFLLFIEIGFIYIPLLFHSLMGFYVVHIGQTNVFRYRHQRNWLYTLQRLTGAITFIFLIYHMGTTVGAKMWEGKHHFEAAPFLMGILNGEFQTVQGIVIYTIGIVSATFHFSNGLWGFCVSWGILIGKNAQRNGAIVFTAIGVGLTFLGLATVLEFYMHPIPVEATVVG
ncbi:MAG: succinate dehydrogenase [Nitrospinota bacterium]|nr:succinate dehydrogenase [Nitrospinota bacterium]